ncbi:hypothetical protein IE81DRAFT_12285 [Ceraceosorus guamensis]|uniref:Uncharacterized protein n=1 Tax=Ceraceosorus guamensis TaxID=1522189 RepID=A0A316W4E5_9BASI|nr:hypothetical protein IE81DRAFT_12285 [Ceraceosorus guamensis]PWN44609.1 hypothetical protein IE81DRAFT_12285 [Ceraceosorus guamensis]
MSSTLTSIAHWPSTSAASGSDASHWHASTSRSAIQRPNHRSPLGSAPHSPILDAMPDGAGRRDVRCAPGHSAGPGRSGIQDAQHWHPSNDLDLHHLAVAGAIEAAGYRSGQSSGRGTPRLTSPSLRSPQIDFPVDDEAASPVSTGTRSPHRTRRPVSMSATSGPSRSGSNSSSSSRDQWWENVLPPGQLAERLRRAQTSQAQSGQDSDQTVTHAGASSLQRSSRTLSEKAIWSGLAKLARTAGDPDHLASDHGYPEGASRKSATIGPGVQRSALRRPRVTAAGSLKTHGSSRSDVGELSPSDGSTLSDTASRQSSPVEPNESASRQERSPSLTSSGEDRLSSSPRLGALQASRVGYGASASNAAYHQKGRTSQKSFSRSTSNRRSRVMSEDGLGLTFAQEAMRMGPTAAALARSSSDEGNEQAGRLAPSPFVEDQATRHDETSRSLLFPLRYLSSTPDMSSEEDKSDSSSHRHYRFQQTPSSSGTVTTTTTRVTRTRTTSVASFADDIDAVDRASDLRPVEDSKVRRRVSFSLDIEPPAGRSVPPSRRGSLTNVKSSLKPSASVPSGSLLADGAVAAAAAAARRRRNESTFDSLPPSRTWFAGLDHRPSSGRRLRTVSRDSFGARMPSYSAPSSPRLSVHLLDAERPPHHFEDEQSDDTFPFSRGQRSFAATSLDQGGPMPDMAVLHSLNIAQTQLASAGNLALTLTRQLSAPLRPVLHVTLFVSISTITLITLLGFLCASYILSVWDDLGSRSRSVGRAAGDARRNIEGGLGWGRRMLLGTHLAVEENSAGSSEETSDAKLHQTTTTHAPRAKTSPLFSSPFALAFPSPAAFAAKLAPSALAERLGVEVDYQPRRRSSGTPVSPDFSSSSGSTSRRASSVFQEEDTYDKPRRPRSSTPPLPPRPPLSHLVPSILLTILIALFASFTSYLTNKRAAEAASQGQKHFGTASSEPMPSRKPRPGGHSSAAATSRSGSFGKSAGRRHAAQAGGGFDIYN